MWSLYLGSSVGSVVLFGALTLLTNRLRGVGKKKISLFYSLIAGVLLASFFLFYPVHRSVAGTDPVSPVLLSLFNALQIFALGMEFSVLEEGMAACPESLYMVYRLWGTILYVLAPMFTFGFVLSLFQNLSAYVKYLLLYFRDVYIFSKLNDRSLALAEDIRKQHPKAVIVFTDVFPGMDESSFELLEQAGCVGAICFKKDLRTIPFGRHAKRRELYFFAIGADEGENLDQTLELLRLYHHRENTRIYVFSTKVEGELLLNAADKGKVKVRRINRVQSLIYRALYEQGTEIFDSAVSTDSGEKQISAVIVGMGKQGTEMVKALAWYGQMDGYRLNITAFDADPLAEERFTALAPELMSAQYNGVQVEGEAYYKIKIHGGCPIESSSFARKLSALGKVTYAFVSLRDDDATVQAATTLRMLFERMGCHPVIHASIHNSRQRLDLSGIKNYRGQAYNIEFLGDVKSLFAESVILNSELEEDALQRHLKWGSEEEFWAYEYNYRSSVASALHMRARVHCGIPGAGKPEEALTEAERDGIEALEHKRWNAYMRSEGYVYSGSPEKESRNDLGKQHHNLVHFDALSEEDKRKDSRVGSL